jgi:hypothetical protein
MCESIQVLERKFGYFPVKFKWAGQVVEIDAVEQCRTEMWGHPKRARYYFKVRCGSILYWLSEDAESHTWAIQPEA